MYLPEHFRETRPEVLHEFMQSHPLVTLVSWSEAGPEANHIPLLFSAGSGKVILRGHLSRANPQLEQIRQNPKVLAIFTGPEHYITPNWYPSKREHGRTVPTWNFTAVHAYGTVRVIDDTDWLLAHVSEMTNRQEARFEEPWKVSDAPESFVQGLLKAIAGLEISIDRLEGKWKVSQNRPATDRESVITELESLGTSDAAAMAALVRERN